MKLLKIDFIPSNCCFSLKAPLTKKIFLSEVNVPDFSIFKLFSLMQGNRGYFSNHLKTTLVFKINEKIKHDSETR